MADEKKKYKYIDTDIDQDLLLANLRHNAQKFVKFKGWDESKAREFYSALTNYEKAIEEGRISSDQSGSLIDSGGILDNGKADWRDKDGNVLSQEQYESLSKRKKKKATQDFYANREVASYIDTIANGLYKKATGTPATPAQTTKFDFAKHGVWKQFVDSMAPGGTGDLKAWLDTDPFDKTTKKRGTAKRAALLNNFINDYIANLSNDIDFAGSAYGNRDTYLQKLQTLQAELANGVDNVDFRLLNQLGANPEEYRAFFTTEQEYKPAEPEREPTEEEKKAAEDKARLNQLSDKYRQVYQAKKYKKYRVKDGATPTGVIYDKDAQDKLTAYMNAANKHNLDFSINTLQTTNGNDYTNYLEQYGEMLPDAVRTITVGNYAGWNYIPESLNREDFSVLAYDPRTHWVTRVFYGDIGQDARDDYAQILRTIDGWNQNSSKPVFQEGGIITSNGVASQFAQAMKRQSEFTIKDPRNRTLTGEKNNYNEVGITGSDVARLSSVVMDIAALIDPEPFSALGLGLASDITTLGADIAEGYGFWDTAGNFAAGVALSAVGMIPIFGDVVGSGGKVVKTMVRLAPKVSKALIASGVLAGIANGDDIIKSLSKIGKDGPENEMTVQDWRNIANGIELIIGGTNAVKNAKTVKKLNQKGKTDMVDVVVKDKTTGDKKTLRFADKADIDALKNAKTVQEANAVIDKHPSFKGKYEINTKEGQQVSWFGADSKWYKPWSWRQTTETSNIAKGAIRPNAVDYQKIRQSYNSGNKWSRSNYIAGHGTPGFNPKNNPEIIGGAPKPSAPQQPIDRLALPSPQQMTFQTNGANPGTFTPAPSQMLSPAELRQTVINARKNRQRLGGNFDPSTTTHSEFGQRLLQHGFSDTDMMSMGIWKEGGKLRRLRRIARGQQGLVVPELVNPFITKKPIFGFDVPELTMPEIKLPFSSGRYPGGLPTKTVKNFGSGYTSEMSYENGEYGTTGKVNISKIAASDAGLRDKALLPAHKQAGYDYADAQANTDRARQSWQADPTNRTKDFMSWARAWYQTEGNQGKSQQDMLADYNRLIDSQYAYKHEMGTDAFMGDNSYRKGDAVTQFNQGNRALYSSANSAGGVHGYSESQQNVNGTTTAQRFIDRTDADVFDLDWQFGDEDSDEFKGLFNGLVKDTSGRYYTNKQEIDFSKLRKLEVPEMKPDFTTRPATAPAVQPTITEGVQDGDDDGSDSGKGKSSINWGGIFAEVAPNALAVGRYLASRAHNKKQLEIARKMPIMLYDPMERLRWIRGDQGAVQEGYRTAGRLNHMASTPVTADGAQQQAAQMEGYMKGVEYIRQGNLKNDEAVRVSTEQNWQQGGENQKSRHEAAMQNRYNLFQHRSNYLSALGQYERANYESLNGLLGQFETQFRDALNENKDYKEAVEKASLQNDISGNLAGYGINATPEEQQLINDVLTGKKQLSSLTATEKASYDRLSNDIQDEVTRRLAAARGVSYRPFRPKTTTSTTFSADLIESQRQGGVIQPESEKITIQKLKGKLQKMRTRQRHLEARMNAFEKDMDRSQRSASQYVRGQKKS